MKVTLIQGDGIGPEITEAVKKVIAAAGVDIEWELVNAGITTFEQTGELIPSEVYESIERTRIVLKGPISTPIGEGFRSINVSLRKKYDLFANIRPIHKIGSVPCLHKDMDLVLFRENTEGLYAGIEERVSEDERRSIKVVTRSKTERIIRAAFEYAVKQGRKKVSVVTKANIMKETDGLFLQIGREIAKDYPSIEMQEILVDNMAMQLVMNPAQFDVIVTGNLYGDILSDLMAGLIGGLGLASSANIGKDIALFEAVHGSAPDIAGKNLANPTALLLASCLMLDYAGKREAAQRIRAAIDKVLSKEEHFTADLGGSLGTEEFTDALIRQL